jgi:general secretion pathway protein G
MNPNRTVRRRRQDGFTLVEIMVVIVIIGLLVMIVAPNVFGARDVAELEKARMDIGQIKKSIDIYLLTNRGVPVPGSFEVLTTPDEKGKVWLEGDLRDPWGNDYVLRPGDRRGDFEILSWGPDGQEGTEDDISSKNLSGRKDR